MSRIDSTSDLLEHLLDAATRRQLLLSQNIANVDTPGYTTRDLDFKRAMAEAERGALPHPALRSTDPQHLAGPERSPFTLFEYEPTDLPRRNDLNNVSIDREMLALGWTAGHYGSAIEILRRRFAILRYAILDGRSG